MKYCIHCGNRLPASLTTWPHQCILCGEFLYNSPKPVVVLVIPASLINGSRRGIIIVKRGINPYKDAWAFPGGYIDHGESWQQAAIREAREEIGVELDPQYLRVDRIETSSTNHLVMFVRAYLSPGDDSWTTHDTTKNANDKGVQEVLEINVSTPQTELGIPMHNRYLKGLNPRTLYPRRI